MTRQDYEFIAAVLGRAWDRTVFENRQKRLEALPWEAARLYKNIVDQFCAVLKEDNPNFDATKFQEVCGAYDGG